MTNFPDKEAIFAYFTYLLGKKAIKKERMNNLFIAYIHKRRDKRYSTRRANIVLEWFQSRLDLKATWTVEEDYIRMLLKKGDDVACKLLLYTAANYTTELKQTILANIGPDFFSNYNHTGILNILLEMRMIDNGLDPKHILTAAKMGLYTTICTLQPLTLSESLETTMIGVMFILIQYNHYDTWNHILSTSPTQEHWFPVVYPKRREYIFAAFKVNAPEMFSVVCDFFIQYQGGEEIVQESLNEILSDYPLLFERQEQCIMDRRKVNDLVRKHEDIRIDFRSVTNPYAIYIVTDHFEQINQDSKQRSDSFLIYYCTENMQVLYQRGISIDTIEEIIIDGMKVLIQDHGSIWGTNDVLGQLLSRELYRREEYTVLNRVTIAECAWLLNTVKPTLMKHHWDLITRLILRGRDLFRMFILYSNPPTECKFTLRQRFGDDYQLGKTLYNLKTFYYSYFRKSLFGHSTISNLLNRMGVEDNTADLISEYAEPNDIRTLWDELVEFKRLQS